MKSEKCTNILKKNQKFGNILKISENLFFFRGKRHFSQYRKQKQKFLNFDFLLHLFLTLTKKKNIGNFQKKCTFSSHCNIIKYDIFRDIKL